MKNCLLTLFLLALHVINHGLGVLAAPWKLGLWSLSSPAACPPPASQLKGLPTGCEKGWLCFGSHGCTHGQGVKLFNCNSSEYLTVLLGRLSNFPSPV